MARLKDAKPFRLRLSRLSKDGDGLFCLPLGFRDVLLDACERLLWTRVWLDDAGNEINAAEGDFDRIEEGIRRLSDMCEIVINNQIELPTPVVNVNVSGGGGCCTDVPVPQLPDGTSYPLIPVDPNDPLGDTVPAWDDFAGEPPPGYPTTQDWIDDRCRAANWFVDSYIEFVKNSDIMERRLSLGAAALDVAKIFIKALPGPVGEWSGFVVILKYATYGAKLLADTVGALENFNDWLQTSVDAIEENKAELVCAAYRMTTVEYLEEFILTFFAGYVSPELEASGVDPTGVNFMRDLLAKPAQLLARKIADGFANMHIPTDYVPGYPCSACFDVPSGFSLVPMEINNIVGYGGSGTAEKQAVFIGNRMEATGIADGGDEGLNVVFTVEKPPIGESRYVGLAYLLENVQNVKNNHFGARINSANWVWGFSSTSEAAIGVPRHIVSQAGSPGYAPPEGAIGGSAEHILINDCNQERLEIGIGGESLVGGFMSWYLAGIYWIREEGNPCP